MNEPTREYSLGEKLAGTTFNPSNDTDVDKVKQAAAKFIDAIHEAYINRTNSSVVSITEDNLWDNAKIRALESQMLAVKAITWKY